MKKAKSVSKEDALKIIKERIDELVKDIKAESNVRKQKTLRETLRSNEVMYVLVEKGLI